MTTACPRSSLCQDQPRYRGWGPSTCRGTGVHGTTTPSIVRHPVHCTTEMRHACVAGPGSVELLPEQRGCRPPRIPDAYSCLRATSPTRFLMAANSAGLDYAPGSLLGPCPDNTELCGSDSGWLECGPTDCSAQGDCFRGRCHCHLGFVGQNCESRICVGDASCGDGLVRPPTPPSELRSGNAKLCIHTVALLLLAKRP